MCASGRTRRRVNLAAESRLVSARQTGNRLRNAVRNLAREKPAIGARPGGPGNASAPVQVGGGTRGPHGVLEHAIESSHDAREDVTRTGGGESRASARVYDRDGARGADERSRALQEHGATCGLDSPCDRRKTVTLDVAGRRTEEPP